MSRKEPSHWLCLSLFTRTPFHDLQTTRDVLMAFPRIAPDIIPERIGLVEPLRHKFGDAFFDKYQGNQSWTIAMFRRRSPAVEGSAGPALFEKYGHLRVFFESTPSVTVSALALFHHWVQIDGLIFAQLAVPSLPMIARGTSVRQVRPGAPYGINMGLGTLMRSVPDLYWLTCFGKEYVNMFGRRKLKDAPVAKVSEGKDHVCLQLTGDPSDMLEQPMLVESIRTRTIRHLGPERFFDPARPRGVAAEVPAKLRKLAPEWLGRDDDVFN